jgi:pimeloyl-ACP methyl ester carboxylesterase
VGVRPADIQNVQICAPNLSHTLTPSRRAERADLIVLVHGAWANTASWSGVITRLEAEGYTVYAPPNPLHSLQGDAHSIADFVKTIKGPVVLVGHSYGGAVNQRGELRQERQSAGVRRRFRSSQG